MIASLAGACLRPLGHLSGTRLIHGNAPEAQGLYALNGRKVWGEQMFWFLRLGVVAVRERAANVGTKLAQPCTPHVLGDEIWTLKAFP